MNEIGHQEHRTESPKLLLREKGRIYFSKDTERKVFFALTLAMLVWGIFTKIGWC